MQKTKNGQQPPDIQIAVENFGPIGEGGGRSPSVDRICR